MTLRYTDCGWMGHREAVGRSIPDARLALLVTDIMPPEGTSRLVGGPPETALGPADIAPNCDTEWAWVAVE
jgi:hypothetical protein